MANRVYNVMCILLGMDQGCSHSWLCDFALSDAAVLALWVERPIFVTLRGAHTALGRIQNAADTFVRLRFFSSEIGYDQMYYVLQVLFVFLSLLLRVAQRS